MGKTVIGDNIRLFRNCVELTQKQLGDLVGVSPEVIDQYERGEKTPRATMLRSMGQVFCIPVEEFLSDGESTDLYRRSKRDMDTKLDKLETNHFGQEEELISCFKQLNGLGQQEAIKRLQELTEIPKYTQ